MQQLHVQAARYKLTAGGCAAVLATRGGSMRAASAVYTTPRIVSSHHAARRGASLGVARRCMAA